MRRVNLGLEEGDSYLSRSLKERLKKCKEEGGRGINDSLNRYILGGILLEDAQILDLILLLDAQGKVEGNVVDAIKKSLSFMGNDSDSTVNSISSSEAKVDYKENETVGNGDIKKMFTASKNKNNP